MPALRNWLDDKFDTVKAQFKRSTVSERWEPLQTKGHTQNCVDIIHAMATLQEDLHAIFKEEGKELWAPTFIQFFKEHLYKYCELVEEILKVLPDFRVPPVPPITSLLQGDKKSLIKKTNRLNNFRGFVDQSPKGYTLKALNVRLANLDYFFRKGITVLGKVMQLEPSQIYNELKDRIDLSAERIADVFGAKIVYSDIYPSLFFQLYQSQDLTSRFPLICDLFNSLSNCCIKTYFQLVLKKSFYYFSEAWKTILLNVDPSTSYCEDLPRVLRNDVNSTMIFFELKQANGQVVGLSREEMSAELTKALEIMVYCPKSDKFLEERFREDINPDDRIIIAWIIFNRQKKEGIEFLIEHKELL